MIPRFLDYSYNKRGWFWIVVVLTAISVLVVVAQPVNYCISVADLTNLRTGYSLNHPIIETVPAGTVLRVKYEGIYGNWLKLDRNDWETWMARWVPHSRVNCGNDSPTPVPAQQPSAQQSQPQSQPQPAVSDVVDNMCQIGWTCTTEEEWIRGWHAYQSGQHTQQQTQSTTQTTNQGGELHVTKGTFQLPTGCRETYRFEGSYFSTLRIECESPEKITDPVPLSWFSCDAYISSRSSWYSEYQGIWHTTTSYDC